MGTNGGCHCVGRVRTDEGLMVQAERLDLVRLLTLARQTPALVAEVRRLRTEVEQVNRVLTGERDAGDALLEQRDEALADVERLRSIVEGRTTPPTNAEIDAHSGLWRWASPADLADMLTPKKAREWARGMDGWGAGTTRWWPIDHDGRPCAWPVVPSP